MQNRIKEIRIKQKPLLTQKQVSEKAKIPYRSYQNYEENKRRPNADALIKIAKALNSTCEELWSEEEKSPHSSAD